MPLPPRWKRFFTAIAWRLGSVNEDDERYHRLMTAARQYEPLWNALETDTDRLHFLEAFAASEMASDICQLWAMEDVVDMWAKRMTRAEYNFTPASELTPKTAFLDMLRSGWSPPKTIEKRIVLFRKRSQITDGSDRRADRARRLEQQRTTALCGVDPQAKAYDAITELFAAELRKLGPATIESSRPT